MSDIVIKAENLGKKYTIGHQAEKGSMLLSSKTLEKVTFFATHEITANF
jgi:hypothetical protein